jgi:hypothetical protein
MLRTARAMAVAGAVATAVLMPMSTPASAVGWPGAYAYDDRTATVRAAPNTGAASLDTIRDNDGRKCVLSNCGTGTGGSYTCWSGGPRGNTWVAVYTSGGRHGFVAAKCVTFQRYE